MRKFLRRTGIKNHTKAILTFLILLTITSVIVNPAAKAFFPLPDSDFSIKENGDSVGFDCTIIEDREGGFSFSEEIAIVGDSLECSMSSEENITKLEIQLKSFLPKSSNTTFISKENLDFRKEDEVKYRTKLTQPGRNWFDLTAIKKWNSSTQKENLNKTEEPKAVLTVENKSKKDECLGERTENVTCHFVVEVQQNIQVSHSVSGSVEKSLSKEGQVSGYFEVYRSEEYYQNLVDKTRLKRHHFRIMGGIAILGFLLSIFSFLVSPPFSSNED